MIRKKKPSGSGKINPKKIRILIQVFDLVGYKVSRQSGSHVILRHKDKGKSLSIPEHTSQDVQPFIIRKLIKQAGISRGQYIKLLKQVD